MAALIPAAASYTTTGGTTDREGWPVAVIEYQGSGHYQGNARERDTVKRTVLARAGIRYIEVAAPFSKRRLHLDAFLSEELRAAAP